jgi:hypothetical protein
MSAGLFTVVVQSCLGATFLSRKFVSAWPVCHAVHAGFDMRMQHAESRPLCQAYDVMAFCVTSMV